MNTSSKAKLILLTSFLSALFTVVLFMVVNYSFNRTWNLFPTKTEPFTVQGTGTAEAAPDQATISFTVTKTEAALKDAQNQANTATNTIVADLQKLGVQKKDIKTSNYTSYPNYDTNMYSGGGDQVRTMVMPVPPQQSQTIVSYTVTQNVEIALNNTAQANQVIDTITKDGAENIYGPNFTFSESKQKELMQQARKQAIADAKEKAQSLASDAGLRLGRIVSVQESGTEPFRPMLMNAKSVDAVGGSVPTELNTGENTVTSVVTLSFETY